MFRTHERRRQLKRAEPGDGSPLQDHRLWQLFSRSLFAIELADGSGRPRPTSGTAGTARPASARPRSTATAAPAPAVTGGVASAVRPAAPRTSAAIGAAGLVVLLVGLAVTLSVAAEALAATDRALRLKSTWMAD